jgi:hypothetical protein
MTYCNDFEEIGSVVDVKKNLKGLAKKNKRFPSFADFSLGESTSFDWLLPPRIRLFP